MNEDEFHKLIDKNSYEVYVFSSPLPFPFSLAYHSWFVLNKQGELSRWEVFHYDSPSYNMYSKPEKNWGHVYKSIGRNLTVGLPKLLFIRHIDWDSKLLFQIKGEEAKKAIDFIETQSPKSIFVNEYRFIPGPNSNTYTQWIINNCFNKKDLLSWRFIGKDFKLK